MRHTVGLKQKFELEYLYVKTLFSYIGMGFIYKLVAMLFLAANHSSMITSAIELVFENSVVCWNYRQTCRVISSIRTFLPPNPPPHFFFQMNHGFIDLFIFKGAVTCCFDYLLNYLQLKEIATLYLVWKKKHTKKEWGWFRNKFETFRLIILSCTKHDRKEIVFLRILVNNYIKALRDDLVM